MTDASAQGAATLDALATVVGVLAATALGLAAGAMLAEAAVLVPWWRSLPAESFLRWYRDNASRLLDFFAPLEIGSAALAVAAAALHQYRRRAGRAAFLASAVLSVAVLAAFPLYFAETNARFAAGTIALDRVAGELARWAAWHAARTAIGVGAFVAAVLGGASRRTRR